MVLIVRAMHVYQQNLRQGTKMHSLLDYIPTEDLIQSFENCLDFFIPTTYHNGCIFTLGQVSFV
jgi:hypothetical protein